MNRRGEAGGRSMNRTRWQAALFLVAVVAATLGWFGFVRAMDPHWVFAAGIAWAWLLIEAAGAWEAPRG